MESKLELDQTEELWDNLSLAKSEKDCTAKNFTKWRNDTKKR